MKMHEKKIRKEYFDVLDNIQDYRLVKSASEHNYYSIFNIPNQTWLIVEEHAEILIDILIEEGIIIVDKVDSLINSDYDRKVMKWDPISKQWVKVSANDF